MFRRNTSKQIKRARTPSVFLFYFFPNNIYNVSKRHAHGKNFPVAKRRSVQVRGKYIPAPPDKQSRRKTETNFCKDFDKISGNSILFIVGKISVVHNNSFPVYKSFPSLLYSYCIIPIFRSQELFPKDLDVIRLNCSGYSIPENARPR